MPYVAAGLHTALCKLIKPSHREFLAGFVGSEVKYSEEFTDTWGPVRESSSKTQFQPGWTIGAGADIALNDRWSVRPEYMYTDFGKADIDSGLLATTDGLTSWPTSVFSHTTDLTSNIARIAVNYKF